MITPARRRSVARTSAPALLAVLLAGAALVAPQAANADPATLPAATLISATGAFSGTVPDGVCFVQTTVLGGAGGSAQSIANANGAGASITATAPVIAGQAYSGTVGGGGASVQTPGINGGGRGGISSTTTHPGAGGAGLSELLIDGDLLILAGGGGGSSGGHTSTIEGFGGDAGLPTTAGEIAPGSDGTDGFDSGPVVGGGKAGTATAAGAGGQHSTDATRNGTAGVGRTGGNGGADLNADTGGGGGAGYFGAGGGASTVNQGSPITGAGGGGGSSYVSSVATGINSVNGPTITTATQANGANGSVSLAWIPCDYDLSVAKSVSGASSLIGSTITWTVAVTNDGPQAMTQGDTVTVADTLPGAGAKTITGISVSGGSNAELERGAVTCNAAVGAAMPASLDCSRPFQILGSAVDGVRGLDVGETLTVTYTQTAAGAFGAVLSNTATVVDRTSGDTNDSSTAVTTLTAVAPVANNDSDLGNVVGTSVPVSVLGNDTGTIIPSSLTLLDMLGDPVSSLVVPGEGTWTVETGGIVRFTPEAGFAGNPTPATYRVTDSNGLTDTATVTVTYSPVASSDSKLANAQGSTVTIDVLGNDTGSFDASSVRLRTPGTGALVTTLAVAGEGTWSVNTTTGAITFTPVAGFNADPTPITYQVTDTAGNVTSAAITITYVRAAALAITGTESQAPLLGALGLLLAGAAFQAVRRFRRAQ